MADAAEYIYGGRKGVFKPKIVETLRPGFTDLIGREFTFRYNWVADEGEAYAGQRIFSMMEGDFTDIEDQQYRAVPEEDIEWLD
jgi:hypothetical protein